MAETTGIAWCDATVNFWWGCTKVSAACDHCYAEIWARRLGKDLWGHGRPRQLIAGATALAFRLERKAVREGRRLKVFSNSMSDFFDSEVPDDWRDLAMAVIAMTPHLDWLVLTKRPKVMREYIDGLDMEVLADLMMDLHRQHRCSYPQVTPWPLPNLWLGVTAEDQKMADLRIPELLATPAAKRFVSIEPLLGPVDLRPYMDGCYECGASCGKRLGHHPDIERCTECGEECGPDTEPVISEGCPKCGGELEPLCPDCSHYMVYQHPDTPVIDWVIVGGESGRKARPFDVGAARDLRDQCKAAGVAFFLKQLGACAFDERNGLAGRSLKVDPDAAPLISRRLKDKAGADPAEWPEDLRVQQFPDQGATT